MAIHAESERRLRLATKAFTFVEGEVRPFIAEGGRLWSKGSRGYPAALRSMLRGLDSAHPVTYATPAALLLPEGERDKEHVVPVKRIIIEIVDPGQADPRSNTSFDPIAGGPAASPEHLLEIYDTLLELCWVTPDEHERLNRAGRSLQWDAPNGDGWARYRLAGVEVAPIAPKRDVTDL